MMPDEKQASNCRLISVGLQRAVPVGETCPIPEYTYPGQKETVHTISVNQFLVCRSDTEPASVEAIHEALGKNRHFLLKASPTGLAIHYDDLPEGFDLHPVAKELVEEGKSTFRILTGPFDELYYRMGRRIQTALEREGIDSIVEPTDGSLENLRRLNERPNTLAIVQHDAAVAAHSGEADDVYGNGPLSGGVWPVPAVADLRRIAALHEERLYVFKNTRQEFQETFREKPPQKSRVDVRDIKMLNQLKSLPVEAPVCLGPPGSGTRLVAEAALPPTRPGTNDEGVKRPVYCSVKRYDQGIRKW